MTMAWEDVMKGRTSAVPTWQGDLMVKALMSARAQALPLATEEAWRRSDPRDFDPFRWTPESDDPQAYARDASAFESLYGSAHILRASGDGFESLGLPLPTGVIVSFGAEAVAKARGFWESSWSNFGSQRFADFHKALANSILHIAVQPGLCLEAPLLVLQPHAARRPALVTTLLEVGRNAGLTLAEDWVQGGDIQTLSHLRLDPGARLEHLLFTDGPEEGHALWHHEVALATSAEYHGTLIFAGGRRHRILSTTSLVGEGAHSRLRGILAAAGRQHFDCHPTQLHQAPRATSDMLFKSAVTGRSHVVFRGDIQLAREARGTESTQTNKNLLLSPTARVDSLPALHILPGDVKCRHGSATGAVDPDHVYYLMSRGFSHDEAVRIIVQAFFADVMADLGEGSLKDFYQDRLAAVSERIARGIKL
jgi:Fe-S cluster assembly scaffold protein SufB